MTMADDDLSAEDQAAADTLINELLEAGFSYEPNGRVSGFAGMPDDEEDEPTGDEPTGDEPTGDEPTGDEPTGDEPTGTEDPTGGASEHQDAGRGAHTGRLELRGTPLTETEADGLLHLRKLLIDHPDLAVRINELAEAKIQGREMPVEPAAPAGQAPVDEPPAAQRPEFIDPDDPVATGLWDEIVRLRQGQVETRETVTTAVDQASRAKVQSDIGAAIDRFKAAHPDLDDDDIRTIRDYTSVNVNIPGVMANFPGDAVEGLVRALEIGSMTDPATRDKVLGVKDDRAARDSGRQKALSALSGGGGSGRRRSAPKKPPGDWNEVTKQLTAELEKLGGAN